MKTFLSLILLLLSLPATAATYYVRTDGGTAAQCTGLTNAAYTGASNACAWSNPLVALPPGGTAKIAGGDTLSIGAGTYKMGFGAPGVVGCSSSYPWDCYNAKIPSGPSWTARTKIVGAGYTGACTAPPKLIGTQRALRVLDLTGTSNVEVNCLEITDGMACGELIGTGAQTCPRSAYPYGDWASHGIYAKGAGKALLRNLNIHGMGNRGILAGGLTDWTLELVKINGNPWAGWDGDVGGGGSNKGTLTFTDVEIAWNGCIEGLDGNATKCFGQSNGGYGDGLGTEKTGGAWVFDRLNVHHNTSDGLDLLYADGTGSVTIRDSKAEGNAGNQMKTSGPATYLRNTVKGNCAYFAGRPDLALGGDNCRALGNSLSIALIGASPVVLTSNVVSGQGDCLLLTQGGAGATVTASSNTFTGGIDYTGGGSASELVCGWYKDGGTATYAWTGNTWANVKPGTAPANSGTAPPTEPPPTEPPPVEPPATCPDNSTVIAALKAQIAAMSTSVEKIK